MAARSAWHAAPPKDDRPPGLRPGGRGGYAKCQLPTDFAQSRGSHRIAHRASEYWGAGGASPQCEPCVGTRAYLLTTRQSRPIPPCAGSHAPLSSPLQGPMDRAQRWAPARRRGRIAAGSRPLGHTQVIRPLAQPGACPWPPTEQDPPPWRGVCHVPVALDARPILQRPIKICSQPGAHRP